MTVLVTPRGNVPAPGRKSWPLAGIAEATPFGGLVQSRGLELIGGAFASYERLYRSQPWVAVCVNKLSRGVARLPLHTYDLDDSTGERERVRTSPLGRLLRRPYPGGSTFRLVESVVGNLALHGNALAVKWRPGQGRAPEELWPIPWRGVTPIGGGRTPIEAYQYDGPGGTKVWTPDEVVHFTLWAPDGRVGISPLEPLRETLALEQAGQSYSRASFENAARPSGALVTPNRLNPKQREELRAEVDKLHSGPENAFRLALLDGGMEWRPFSHTSQESELIDHRRLNREEVAAVFDIPPPIIGILDRATFSNVSEQHRMLYMDTMGPWLTLIDETLSVQLIEPEPAWEGLFAEFNLNEVLKGNHKERSESYQRELQSGLATPNELRALENRPRIDHPLADSIFIPVNMRAAGPGADLTPPAPGPGARRADDPPAGEPASSEEEEDPS